MADKEWRIAPMGDRGLVIELGRSINPVTNRTVHALADYLRTHPIAGVVDIVPGFNTVAIHYRPQDFSAGALSPYRQLSQEIEEILQRGVATGARSVRAVEIPVCYGGEFGPDLGEVAAACGLTPEQVVQLHCESESVVYMLGFAPGQPYVGGLDSRLIVPRRSTPRTIVPEGSVAIANGQTSIYAMQSPGGWSLIGATPLKMFDPDRTPPARLEPGDRLHFVPISQEQYHAMRERKQ
jgi:KipI family sensor histidine kinase inhibitor